MRIEPAGAAPPGQSRLPRNDAEVLLSDGSIAVVRPLRPDDRRGVEALHEAASDTSFRRRFFSSGRTAGRQYVDHLFSQRPAQIALLALVADEVVAVGTAEHLDDSTAEVAFLVADDHRGRGLGSLLLEHLAAAGRDDGLTRLVAEVLSENTPMLHVFSAAGFVLEVSTIRGTTDVTLEITSSTPAVRAADERESRSEARSLAALSRPTCIAVVADDDASGTALAAGVVTSVLRGGFTGTVHAVHPRAREVGGVRTVRRLVDVPGGVDLVVSTVPSPAAARVLREAAAAGAGVVVDMSVTADGDATGMAIDDAVVVTPHELAHVARTCGTRLIGPGSLGIRSTDPAVRLDATAGLPTCQQGGIALAVETRAAGRAITGFAHDAGLGVHSFVSLGEKADVSGNDLLSAWAQDPTIRAGALCLHSFGNAPKFLRLARQFADRRPLLLLLGPPSMPSSPLGAAPAREISVLDLLDDVGVIRCADAEDLVRTAGLLTTTTWPRRPGNGPPTPDQARAARLRRDILGPVTTRRTLGLAATNELLAAYGVTAGCEAPAAAGRQRFRLHVLRAPAVGPVVVVTTEPTEQCPARRTHLLVPVDHGSATRGLRRLGRLAGDTGTEHDREHDDATGLHPHETVVRDRAVALGLLAVELPEVLEVVEADRWTVIVGPAAAWGADLPRQLRPLR